MDTPTIAILHGDQTGEEMLVDALRVLHPLGIAQEDYDLSIKNRRDTNNDVVRQASEAICRLGVGVKAATNTEADTGSPNLLIREIMDADVILRTGRRLPGIAPKAGVHYPIHIVRMATGEAYGAKEWRVGKPGSLEEVAMRTETITRKACRAVAEYTFLLAERENARVFGGPKWTVSAIYEAMLKEEMDRAAGLYPDVEYWPMLIDATYAGLVNGSATDRPVVIPTLNRDGDSMADLVLPLYGSIAGAGSAIISFDDKYNPIATMHEAAHGTAPTLEGQNVANPLAMILGCAAAVGDLQRMGYEFAYGRKEIEEAAMDTISAGTKTRDLGGTSNMSEYTDAVLERLNGK